MMLLVIKFPSEGMLEVGIRPGDLFELTDVVEDEDVCPVHGRTHQTLFEVRLLSKPSAEWQAQPWRFELEESPATIVAPNSTTLH